MATADVRMERHPDIVALRAHYDEAAENPVAQAADGLTVLAGLYLAASAWIVGFSDSASLAITNLIAGVVVAALAVGFTSAYGRIHGVAFTIPVLGLWMIVAPWVVVGVTTTTPMIWSNVLGGAAVLAFSLTVMALGMMRRHN